MNYSLDYVAISDRGLVRQNNEDSAYAGPRLLALADGMGGHAAGEVASQLMIAQVSKLDADQPDADLLDALALACAEGNSSIAEEIDANPATEGMGTTLTALLFDGERVGLCHVGDSRGYLLRDGELTQITRDDTYVQSLVDEGSLTAEEASMHPQRSLILKALTGRPVEPTLKYREVRRGDRYLLCSDGLSDPVSRETIAEALAEGTPKEAANRLIELALRSGGPDNVTIVIADVVAASADTPNEPALAGALGAIDSEAPRPNTSAGRAAAMRPPAEQERAVTTDPVDDPPKQRGRWLVATFVVLALVASAAVGLWGWRKNNSMYHLAVEDGVIQVMHGVPGSVLGFSLHSHHQYICLSDDNAVTLPDPESDRGDLDCHLMTPEDLSPSARSQLDGLPADSYDEIRGQVGRLAEQALPVCLTVAPGDEADPADGTTTPGAPGAEAPEGDNADNADGADGEDPGTGSEPGVNCREVQR
ncbi:PP2C family serine/threonine-protein phosphatase [Corynebacterium sp. HMSC11E11]|uniref:PP2C family protein-serine/threonine phosphatase n=1 Tax=Corynebacterium sp. HMSC11E11 TaxID=1581089 RepID=UPI0008A33ADF|nr:protein phosphatase 2C domain-containing protein [Corynebacterium sp. HMSC11E11]OFU58010.1 serine/threonine protein phosphatase [Corynebacterium sp. HMSC11E11]